MKTTEKTSTAPEAGKIATLLFSVISFLLLIVLCLVSFLSYNKFNRRLDELETALAEAQSSIAALSEAESRLTLSIETKADKEALDAFSSRLDAETSSFVKAIAHRGLSSEAPENTLPAFVRARKAGFRYVETDIRFTADGYPICMHDLTVDSVSDGIGSPSELTLEELRSLDFGSWMGEEFAGTGILRFEEFLVLCRDLGLHPYIELKEGTWDQIGRLVKTVEAYGMADDVTWISFNRYSLETVKQNEPSARIGYLVTQINDHVISEARSLRTGKNRVFLNSSSYTAPEIQRCREAGFPLEVWTIDAANQIASLDPYISGVTSNTLRADLIMAEAALAG